MGAIGKDSGAGCAGSGGSGKSLAKLGADPALPGNNKSNDKYYYSHSQMDYEREVNTEYEDLMDMAEGKKDMIRK